MKLKYQLRGIGIGLVITTIILTIAHGMRDVAKSEYTPKETASSGSILAFDKDAIDKETSGGDKESVGSSAAIEKDTSTTASKEVVIHIIDVYYASQAADILFDAGVITDKEGFVQYLGDNGYAETIKEGYYTIKVGDSFENIAKIITRSE